jgi:hypothetical protein
MMSQRFFDLPPEERKLYVQRIKLNNEELIPVILRFGAECSFTHKITNTKLLIPKHQRIMGFLSSFRKQYKLLSDAGLCLSFDEILLKSTLSFEEVYNLHRSEDMVLYLKMHEMTPFGQPTNLH